MFIILQVWNQAIVMHCTLASFLIFWLHYSIVLLWCLYIVCEKYVFACALQQSHPIHTAYCSRLCLMEPIQRGSTSCNQYSKRTFISTRYRALFMSFLYAYNLSQITNKEDFSKERIAGFVGQAYFPFYFILFTSYLLVTSLELCPNKTLKNLWKKSVERTCFTLGMGSTHLFPSSLCTHLTS